MLPMPRRVLWLLSFMLCVGAILLCGQPVVAAPPALWQLNVDNQPCGYVVRTVRESVYVDLQTLLEAGGRRWHEFAGYLLVESLARDNQPNQPSANISSDITAISLGGFAAPMAMQSIGGRLYVDLQEFSTENGDTFTVNTAAAEVSYHFANRAEETWNRLNSSDLPSKLYLSSPLRLTALSSAIRPAFLPEYSSLFGYASCKNVGSTALKNLVLRLAVFDAQGELQGESRRWVDSLLSGDTLTWQFPIWTNFLHCQAPRAVIYYRWQARR